MSLEAQLHARFKNEQLKDSFADLHGWLRDVKSGKIISTKSKDAIKEIAETKRNAGNSCVHEQAWLEAISHYSEGIEALMRARCTNSLLAILHLNRALCYFNTGNFTSCVGDCTASLKIEKSTKGFVRRGRAYQELFMWNKALSDLESARKIATNNPDLCELIERDTNNVRNRIHEASTKERDSARLMICTRMPAWSKHDDRETLVPVNISGDTKESSRYPMIEPIMIKDSEPYIPRSVRMRRRAFQDTNKPQTIQL